MTALHEKEHDGALQDIDVSKMESMGFEDNSWHNDICPQFINENAGIRIWCDYKEIQDREFDDCYERFIIRRLNDSGDEIADVFATENYNELIAYLEKWRYQEGWT